MPSSLLDTDILSEVLKQKNPFVIQGAAAYLQIHKQFTFSAFTRYEVVRGLKAKAASRQLQQFTSATGTFADELAKRLFHRPFAERFKRARALA